MTKGCGTTTGSSKSSCRDVIIIFMNSAVVAVVVGVSGSVGSVVGGGSSSGGSVGGGGVDIDVATGCDK